MNTPNTNPAPDMAVEAAIEHFESACKCWHQGDADQADSGVEERRKELRAAIAALARPQEVAGVVESLNAMIHYAVDWMQLANGNHFDQTHIDKARAVRDRLYATPSAGAGGSVGAEPLTTKEIADLTAMVWGAPVADNDLKLAEFVIRAHEAILKTGERPKDPVDGGRYIEVPGAFGEGT